MVRTYSTEVRPQTGKTIEEKREEARADLAQKLLGVMAILVGGTVVVGAFLLINLPTDQFSSKDLMNLVLGVGSIFSGLLGAAITFYFSSEKN